MGNKKIIALLLSLVFTLGTAGCVFESRQSQVLDTLGDYEQKQMWTRGEFQDYTDFGIYQCESPDLEDNAYFRQVTQADMETICGFLDNYEQWIETFRKNDPGDPLVQNYFFNRNWLDTQDYFYIYNHYEEEPYWDYDLWVFDSQTNMLFYFHTNI